jgi:hypothetical protein
MLPHAKAAECEGGKEQTEKAHADNMRRKRGRGQNPFQSSGGLLLFLFFLSGRNGAKRTRKRGRRRMLMTRGKRFANPPVRH